MSLKAWVNEGSFDMEYHIFRAQVVQYDDNDVVVHQGAVEVKAPNIEVAIMVIKQGICPDLSLGRHLEILNITRVVRRRANE